MTKLTKISWQPKDEEPPDETPPEPEFASAQVAPASEEEEKVDLGPALPLYLPDREEISMRSLKAQAFVDKIAKGMKPAKAAKELGEKTRELLSMPEVQSLLAELRGYSFSEAVRKEIAKSITNHIALANVGLNDKLALDAAKEMARQEGLGGAPVQVGLQVDLGALGSLLEDKGEGNEPE